MKKILPVAACAIIASVLVACGSGSGTTVPATIRLVNLTPSADPSADGQMSLSLNGTTYQTGAVSPGQSTGYVSVTPSTYTGSVDVTYPSGATSTPLISSATLAGLGLGTGQNYSIFAYPRQNVVYVFGVTDNVAGPAAGLAELDVANAAPDAGALDVYVVTAGSTTPLQNLAASFTSVQGQGATSTAIPFIAGTSAAGSTTSYDVYVTGSGNPGDVRLSMCGMTLASGQVYNLALTSSSGGTLVNAALVQQGANNVSLYANTQARVRLISALGGTTLPAYMTVGANATALQIYTGQESAYTAVAGGAQNLSVTVGPGGAAVPVAGQTNGQTTFAAGSDYTVLVYGSVSSPQALVLADDNHFISNKASVRLINAADPASGLSMYIQNQIVASNVVLGTSSGYFGVATKSGASLLLQSSDYKQTMSQDLVNGGVYTVVLYDVTQPPVVFQDR